LLVSRILVHIGTLCREMCNPAEPIKMQFQMLSQVGPGNVYYMEM